jgi:hypothetical protein
MRQVPHRNATTMRHIIHHEAWPPLLRGAGTLLILVASAFALAIEGGDIERRYLVAERPPAGAVSAVRPAAQDELVTLAREIRLLRLRDDDLSDRVLRNALFQVLGLLGTAVLAASFFVEAWQKRVPPDAEAPESV